MARTRFTLEVGDSLSIQLVNMASYEGTTVEVLLRKALFLYLTASSVKRQSGQQVVFYDPATLRIEVEVINL